MKFIESDDGAFSCEEVGQTLVIDVRGLNCPEYVMKAIQLFRAFKKETHEEIHLQCCAPSIADQVTQMRLSSIFGKTITANNINFARNSEDVKIPKDDPVVLVFN